jgi:hypothetical protein
MHRIILNLYTSVSPTLIDQLFTYNDFRIIYAKWTI